MGLIDWMIVACPLVLLIGVARYTRRYMKGVAHFLSGGRLAGRYLLAVAKGEQGTGAVVFVASFEVIANSGFVLTWWGWMTILVGLVVSVSGWVIYRFRETRALTLAQFFEIRYSKSFRIFTGLLGFCAGMANFGIIPAVGARFLTYFLGLPAVLPWGGWMIPTYIPLMAVLLGLTLALTLSGGLITLMITNCLEGIISQILFLIIIFSLLATFHWSQINGVLSHRPPGHSLLNPFDSFALKDFNIWFVLIGVWGAIYRTMAWQNQGAYSTASLTAHESRMGGILSNWRGLGNGAVITLLAICAMTFMAHPDFAASAARAKAEIAQIPAPAIQSQMTLPIAVSQMLPVGVKGCLCVILLMGVFGGDGTQLLSWGGIFIQDVVLPFRTEPFRPEQHVRLLRWAVAGVALCAFLFGTLFRQTEYILMWWMVTEALFVGGAGVAIIGGLYWKKGTTAGAWAGVLVGSGLVTGGILARQFLGDAFPLNGAEISFFGSLTAVVTYAVVSLLTCREDFNMERLLHRGRYAVASEKKFETTVPRKTTWGRLIGLDEHFTAGDKWLAGGLFVWSIGWFLVFLVGSGWNLAAPWTIGMWSRFWYVAAVGLPIFFAVVTGIWFTWGGVRDMKLFFQRLREERPSVFDNGMVVDHQSLDEVANSRNDKPGM